mgnify:CR=1 FL=1
MLWFERRVVEALMRPGLAEPVREAVVAHVELSLRAMPEHLRLGVLGESVLLGLPAVAARATGHFDQGGLARRVDRWREHPIDLVRQYVRLLGSLVLFAEEEYGAPTGDSAAPTEVRPDGTETYLTSGWLRASHRKLDPRRSTATRAVPTHLPKDGAPLEPGKRVDVRIPINPVAAWVRKGSRLRVTLQIGRAHV